MNSSLCQCRKSRLRSLALACGACAVGFAEARPVDEVTERNLRRWLAEGRHGTMQYMANHLDIRLDPRLLLPGAQTVVSLAFSYRPPDGYHHSCIADYALGRDYHQVVRSRLQPFVEAVTAEFGGLARICVDSAPILERYWAVQAGVGFVGRNRQLIVPGVGSEVFLCEVITTLQLPPDEPCAATCGNCGACVAACPGCALTDDGSFDARRCISYLTTEFRGEFPPDTDLHGSVVGCDVCQRVCPHNRCEPPEPVDELLPDSRLLALDRQTFARISSGEYRRISRISALSRLSIAQIRRNLLS